MSACLWLLLLRCAVPFRFILPLHLLIRHYTSRKCSYATTSPDAHTHRRQDHFWILLRCVKILFYLFILQGSFYILAQSLKCALQFFEYNVDVELLQPPQLPLAPSSTGRSILPIVLLFEMLYHLFGWVIIPEKKHIQRTAIRYCTVCFQVGCFQATLNEIPWAGSRTGFARALWSSTTDMTLDYDLVWFSI